MLLDAKKIGGAADSQRGDFGERGTGLQLDAELAAKRRVLFGSSMRMLRWTAPLEQ